MFTGIIQGEGRIARLDAKGSEMRLLISPSFEIPSIVDGESIAVNGVCLSVETHSGSNFSLYASAETMRRTTLGELREGSAVNLERALALGDRLGGHIVAGHVDCVATVESAVPCGDSIAVSMRYPEAFSGEVVEKGSIALDGISLTVNECQPGRFSVNIIPDTQLRTTMRHWKPGVHVNMETDVIGKYVKHLLGAYVGKPSANPFEGEKTEASRITRAYLLENGFL